MNHTINLIFLVFLVLLGYLFLCATRMIDFSWWEFVAITLITEAIYIFGVYYDYKRN